MKKLIASIVFLGLIGAGIYAGPIYLDYKIEKAIAMKLNDSLGQSIKYDEMNAAYFSDTISFDNVIMHDTGKPETLFNFKANKVDFQVNYRNAIMKNFKVQKITANNVSIVFDYSNKSVSNIHNIQQNLRDYLAKKKEQGIKNTVEWDVYDITLNNVTIQIRDYQYGEIGTFLIPKLKLPHISSAYDEKSNKDVMFIAIGVEISRLAYTKTLNGEYDKYKLGKFTLREAESETLKVINKSKNALYSKGKNALSSYFNNKEEKALTKD